MISDEARLVKRRNNNYILRALKSDEAFPLKGEMLVGREIGCAIALSSGQVSGYHAKINVMRSGVYIEDLQSESGTFVNGKRIKGRVLLSVGDKVRFDEVAFRLDAGEQETRAGADHPDKTDPLTSGSGAAPVNARNGSSNVQPFPGRGRARPTTRPEPNDGASSNPVAAEDRPDQSGLETVADNPEAAKPASDARHAENTPDAPDINRSDAQVAPAPVSEPAPQAFDGQTADRQDIRQQELNLTHDRILDGGHSGTGAPTDDESDARGTSSGRDEVLSDDEPDWSAQPNSNTTGAPESTAFAGAEQSEAEQSQAEQPKSEPGQPESVPAAVNPHTEDDNADPAAGSPVSTGDPIVPGEESTRHASELDAEPEQDAEPEPQPDTPRVRNEEDFAASLQIEEFGEQPPESPPSEVIELSQDDYSTALDRVEEDPQWVERSRYRDRNRIPEKEFDAGTGPRLIITSAPLRGKFFELEDNDTGVWKIGQAEDAFIHLTDMSVAADHAHLTRMDDGYQLAATHPKNFLMVNGISTNCTMLAANDRIQIGSTDLVFKTDEIDDPNNKDALIDRNVSLRHSLIGALVILTVVIAVIVASGS